MNPFQLLSMFPTVYFGRHLLSPKVEYSKAERVKVETETPLEIYADGELVCETPAEISIAPGALRVVPRPHSGYFFSRPYFASSARFSSSTLNARLTQESPLPVQSVFSHQTRDFRVGRLPLRSHAANLIFGRCR